MKEKEKQGKDNKEEPNIVDSGAQTVSDKPIIVLRKTLFLCSFPSVFIYVWKPPGKI